MALPLSSQQDLYTLFKTTLQAKLAALTDFLDGSIADGLAGTYSIAGMELQRQTILQFNKTFIDLANGPEITGGPDDLQTLAVDHYGDEFARPEAAEASDTQTFQRPNNTYGSCDIPSGTVVETQPDANGNVQEYTTNADVVLTHAGAQTFTCTSANATNGAVYSDANGAHYTVNGTITGGTSLATTGTTLPPASGTLTKVSGTGDATITYSAVSAPDCLVTVGITASVAGSAGDAVAGAINVISSTILDSSVTTSNAGNQTGADAQNDATYRETIRNLLVSLKAAVKSAIEGAALSVTGVISATAVEVEQAVVNWNIGGNTPLNAPVAGLYEYYYIPFVSLYIAQASGPATGTQITQVEAAIASIRAFGVNISVVAATTFSIDWSLDLLLNPAGPNYSTFSTDTTQIRNAMSSYIATLGTGVSFIRQTAEAAILANFGPKGTNDLVAQYTFVVTSCNATEGATYTDGSGNTFTVANTVAASTSLVANSNGGGSTCAPLASGTLTKTGGTGDATITFSSAETNMTEIPTGDVSIGATQNAIPGTMST